MLVHIANSNGDYPYLYGYRTHIDHIRSWTRDCIAFLPASLTLWDKAFKVKSSTGSHQTFCQGLDITLFLVNIQWKFNCLAKFSVFPSHFYGAKRLHAHRRAKLLQQLHLRNPSTVKIRINLAKLINNCRFMAQQAAAQGLFSSIRLVSRADYLSSPKCRSCLAPFASLHSRTCKLLFDRLRG